MPVKHWSRAGLMLTAWCNARCASCYLCCGPDRADEMPVATALRVWEELIAASPHGCRIHLTGGEPFGSWERLIELCLAARAGGLGPLESVETNAFWASSPALVGERLRALDQAGMGKLVISADPYHQQFVPIERPRLLARVGEDVLGAHRVQVRWRDWLETGGDTDCLAPPEREALFARYAAAGRERVSGRAAFSLSASLPQRSPSQLADTSCSEPLLRAKHVHVAPDGSVMPGTCGGLVLGRCDHESVAVMWQRLGQDWADRPVVGALARGGPAALLATATAAGFVPEKTYAGKCHLCWHVRRFLHRHGAGEGELGPDWLYQA
ncbi:MAG: radical SAM protein [Planctomycetota bacterium]|nr:radical SAM protein [Planctomycetota bacterium]